MNQKIKNTIAWFFTPPHIEKLEQELQQEEILHTKEKQKLPARQSISTKSMALFWGIGLLFVFIGYYLFNFLNTLFIILGAYIISIIMEGIINFFENKKIKRPVAIIISYTIFIIITLLCIIFISPLIIDQITGLIKTISTQVKDIQTVITTQSPMKILQSWTRLPDSIRANLTNLLQTTNVDFNEVLKASISKFLSGITNTIGIFGNITVQTLNIISGFFLKLMMILFLSILFSVEKDVVSNFLISLFPERKRKVVKLHIQRMYQYLAFWFKYRLALSVFMFSAMYLAFWILYLFGIDISHKFSLSLSLAILDIIPYIGPIIAAILMFFSAIIEHTFLISLIVPIMVMIINTTENTVIIPYIMNKSMGVSLILTFVCMLLGGLVMGLLGVFLSIPFAMILTLFFSNNKPIKKIKK